MMTWLQRAMQTRTPVHNAQAERRERETGQLLAFNTLSTLMIGLQLVLWVIFAAYDQARQTTWQAALMQAAPIAVQWLIWRKAGSTDKPGAVWALPLIICLMLDHFLLMFTSSALMNYTIPSFPLWARLMVVGIFPPLTAWMCGEKGVAYGAYALRIILLVSFVLVLAFTSLQPNRLWPLMGKGFSNTAMTALGGAGAAWGVALFYLFPKREARINGNKGGMLQLFLWLPLCVCLLWALWMAMVGPWRVEDGVSPAQQLIALSQYSSSMIIGEVGIVLWMLALPIGLAGTLIAGFRLLENVFPKLRRLPGVVLLALPGVVGLAFSPLTLPAVILAALPWRFVLSAVTGLGLIIAHRRGGRS